LAEANRSESQMREVPEGAGRLMAQLPDDVVVREQYLDFFKNRMFRQTLLCHADAPVSRELDEMQIERFAISSQAQVEDAASSVEQPPSPLSESSLQHPEPSPKPSGQTFTTPEGYTVTTSEPLVLAAMHVLVKAWPAAVNFPTLLAAAQDAAGTQAPPELVRARLRAVLLQAHLARIVQLGGCAPLLATGPGDRPLASPLARAQCAAGLFTVSSLLHANVRLEEDDRGLLALLDGTRDRGALLEDRSVSDLDNTLERFASLGLLHG
ncbi:MAG: methyltransferase regulatory domain-containing protein, partial [Solirubrobacteraceae bacterium]